MFRFGEAVAYYLVCDRFAARIMLVRLIQSRLIPGTFLLD